MKLRHYLLFGFVSLAAPFMLSAADNSTAKQTELVIEEKDAIAITVNINQASAEELATLLVGVGIKKAQAIVDYRKAFGEFKTKDELMNVKGIGPSIILKNETRILW